jgi:bacterioferritin-associated ferredoxin
MGEEVKRPIIICRCHDVTLDDIVNAIKSGVDNFEVLRKYLRIGFGPCQGRSCVLLAARIFSRLSGVNLSEALSEYKVRPPIIPVAARVLLAGGEK